MEFPPVIVLLAAVIIVLAVLLGKARGRLHAAKREKEDIEGEEHRFFDFLHHLGSVIEADAAGRRLYRVIVDGVEEVVGGDGAGLFLLSADGEWLVPGYLSDGCPPLGVVPETVRAEIGGDEARLKSYLRLAKVTASEGLMGECLAGGTTIMVQDVVGERVEAMLAPVSYASRALGILAVTRLKTNVPFSRNDFDVFRSISEQSAYALGNAMVHQEAGEKRRMDRELRVAREVQQVLLPSADPDLPGYRIHGTNLPARIISGDYYDYIPLENNWFGVAIADVSGKGISAGLLMTMCRSVLRSAALESDSPAAALATVNRQLFPDIREDMFISMAYIVLENGSDKLRLARGGHDAPLMWRKASKDVEYLKPAGLAIGVDDGAVFERVTRDLETDFRSGDCLLLYTDGVTEAENEAGEEFGTDRMRDVFQAAAPEGAEGAVRTLKKALEAFVGGNHQMDDITMIVIEKR
ncbi:MAG: PP2C family protein-serine/threonine phosphatase [Akkermansiaceae bacterium]|nr:PP2C family protein-serine/threonine phosphatase [Akkermansiaceae bacterium]